MTTKSFRTSNLFLRNEFEPSGKYGFPLIKKQSAHVDYSKLIACSDTSSKETEKYRQYGVHFFVDDWRFNGIYYHPEQSIARFSQYAFLLTPDYSSYNEMQPWRQIQSVGMNRWVGAYWQKQGLVVVPTISWSRRSSFSYCFDAIEKGSVVAVGMVGCKQAKSSFLVGYNEMLKRIEPSLIICFGTPFNEMEGNILSVDYMSSRKKVR